MVAASVVVNGTAYTSDAGGTVTATLATGRVEIVVSKEGFAPVRSPLVLAPGQEQSFEMELQGNLEETVTVSATRTDQRVEGQPMRVEVVPGEEVLEKIYDDAGGRLDAAQRDERAPGADHLAVARPCQCPHPGSPRTLYANPG